MTTLAEIKTGECFKVADIEFIKTGEENGQVTAVAKNSLFDMTFGNNNNYAESNVKKKLESEILPRIEEVVGAENIIEHEVDLLSLDGDDKWGKAICKISLPTFDYYRRNVKLFDEYKLNDWWWLSTPDTTVKHYNDNWVVGVSPRGYFNYNCSFCSDGGVRPFIIFVSSISVISESCEG